MKNSGITFKNLVLHMKCVRHFSEQSSFLIPWTKSPTEKNRELFLNFMSKNSSVAVLTGAGVSTESGIPDYRSETGLYKRTKYRPIDYSTFLKNKAARIRYWARNYVGWPEFSSKEPNGTHFALQLYEAARKVSGIITQNVDGLHHKASGHNIIELHGNAYWVKCLSCKNLIFRHDFQKILDALNPSVRETGKIFVRPDGDVEIDEVC